MARIKDLRAKVKAGIVTDAEKEELEALEAEAKDEDDKEVNVEVNVTEPNEEEMKDLVSMGKKLGELAFNEMQNRITNDTKKGIIGSAKAESKEQELTGKEKVKAFFEALLDNDKVKLDHMSEGTAGDGGSLVPQEYADQFVEDRRNLTVMRRAGATVVNVMGSVFNIPQLATRPKVSWSGELAAKASTSASWANITLTPYTLAAYMTASNQVIADARIGGNLVDVMTRLLTQAIAEEEDKAFFVGTGSGQPTGLNTYTVTSTDAGGAINFSKLNGIKYRLGQMYRTGAAWFMNSRTLQVVSGLLDTQNRPIFTDSFNEDFPRLLGKPVYEQDNLPSSQIWFGDAAGYWIGDREGISVRVSDEATVSGQSAFERNFTIVRVEERVDGELADTKSFVEITNTGVA